MRAALLSRTALRTGGARRGMATEKQLKERMMATQNIEKITKSMKMVSAAKLRGDQQRLAAATPFARWAETITGKPEELEGLEIEGFSKKNLIVTMTTDKGLCGGVNSILCRMTKQLLEKLKAEGKEFDLFIMGEKGKSILQRVYAGEVSGAATDRVMPYTFDLACALSVDAMGGKQYDQVHLIYNKFKSAIAYTPSVKTITPLLEPASPALYSYTVEPENDEDTLSNFFEYTLASQVFHSLMENATSEQSSRMSAMENASKNAGEQINALNLAYNRARQTRITTELIEIISGAAALEK